MHAPEKNASCSDSPHILSSFVNMFQNLFSSGQPVHSVSAALSISTAPKQIVKACVNQILGQSQKKDKELRDLMKVRFIYDTFPAFL